MISVLSRLIYANPTTASGLATYITYNGGEGKIDQWECPANVYAVSAMCIGGGGGGGSAKPSGGGGGGVGIVVNYPVTPGQFYLVVVGARGHWGGIDGGASYFVDPSVCCGYGGEGGGGFLGAGGDGGLWIGDIGGAGGKGGDSDDDSSPAGGGGGAGGYNGDGGAGGDAYGATGTDSEPTAGQPGQGGGAGGGGGQHIAGNGSGFGGNGAGTHFYGIGPAGGGGAPGSSVGDRKGSNGGYGSYDGSINSGLWWLGSGQGGSATAPFDYSERYHNTPNETGNGAVILAWGPGRQYPDLRI